MDKAESQKTYGLGVALSGGGARGFAHAGAGAGSCRHIPRRKLGLA